MAEPGTEPHDCQDNGRRQHGLIVLHVGGDGTTQESGDEEQPRRARPRDQKEQRAQHFQNRYHRQLAALEAEGAELSGDLGHPCELRHRAR
jgi:hypothetical protein